MSSTSSSAPASPQFKPSMTAVLSDIERAERCAYPSKPCPHPRAVKLNGDLHNFCNFHRRKANMNQRRWQQRRRRMRGADAPSSPQTPRSEEERAVEIETAKAVAMLHRSGEFYPSTQQQPQPEPQAQSPHHHPHHHQYSRYPSYSSEEEWSPRPVGPIQLPRQFAPVFRPTVNVLPSSLPRTFPYVVDQAHSPVAIPPLRSLPALLPSSFLGSQARPSRPMSAHVSTY